mmetsp:Transcript_38209/g.63055  ORF Transcript_38209/g.63055 Transcript_38209/m.63055 type:complete len:95 (+) Transcript_38209:293-577(+)
MTHDRSFTTFHGAYVYIHQQHMADTMQISGAKPRQIPRAEPSGNQGCTTLPGVKLACVQSHMSTGTGQGDEAAAPNPNTSPVSCPEAKGKRGRM